MGCCYEYLKSIVRYARHFYALAKRITVEGGNQPRVKVANMMFYLFSQMVISQPLVNKLNRTHFTLPLKGIQTWPRIRLQFFPGDENPIIWFLPDTVCIRLSINLYLYCRHSQWPISNMWPGSAWDSKTPAHANNLPHCRINTYNNSYFPLTMTEWNNLLISQFAHKKHEQSFRLDFSLVSQSQMAAFHVCNSRVTRTSIGMRSILNLLVL